MIVYVVHGDIYYDGEYFEGAFSAFDKAEQHAETLPDCYDEVTIREIKLDDPTYDGDKWSVK
ncbi:hypothetical protein [Shigella phage ESh4]|nr:hypothetical protein [Shigella phage ESh4]